MPLKVFPYDYRRDLVKHMPGIFVYGDNVHHKGYKGQAVIRGLPNSFGFSTKWLPLRIPDAYFSDDDPEAWNVVNKHLFEVESMLVKGKKVWWPVAGIGTGLAEWPQRAPSLLARVDVVISDWLTRY